MVVQMYQNFSDIRCKEKQLNYIRDMEVTRKDTKDIYDFSFTCTKFDGYLNCNFFYIPDYNLWYYRETVNEQMGDILKFIVHVDPLQSLKDYVNNLYTLIVRQENIYSPYMVDSKLPTRVNRVKDVKKIGQLDVDQTGKCIVITVTGGTAE